MILCVGGSVCRGVRVGRAWPSHLWERSGVPTATLADRGADASWALHALPRLACVRPDWLVLQLGEADARGSSVSLADYLATIEHAVTLAGELWPAARVVACTPTPIGKPAPRGWNRSSRRWVRRIVPGIEEVGARLGVRVAPLHEMPVGLLGDGVHPTPDGHRWIAARVALAMLGPQ